MPTRLTLRGDDGDSIDFGPGGKTHGTTSTANGDDATAQSSASASSPSPPGQHEEDIRLRALRMRKASVARHVASPSFRRLSQKRRKEFFASDLSASPRLLDYNIGMVACLIEFISATVFLFGKEFATMAEDLDEHTELWKRRGAIAFGAVGFVLFLAIICCHFDAMFYPDVWTMVFKDGSRYELGILVFLFLFWVVGLHVCTSTFTVGLTEPNVYFASWVAMLAVMDNINNWRIGAGKKSFYLICKDSPYPTTLNLVGVAFFSAVAFFSILDAYSASELYADSYFLQSVTPGMWASGLSVSGVTLVLAPAILLVNHRWLGSNPIWKYCEGFLLLGLVAIWVYAVFTGTGIGNIVNGINNIYFGVWGTFFMSLIALGSWLQGAKKPKDDA